MQIKKRSPWKIDPELVRLLNRSGKSDRWIAVRLGYSQTGVSRARQRLNLPPNYHCEINKNGISPRKLYESAVKRSRDYKKEHMNEILAWNKSYRDNPKYRRLHAARERERRRLLKSGRGNNAKETQKNMPQLRVNKVNGWYCWDEMSKM